MNNGELSQTAPPETRVVSLGVESCSTFSEAFLSEAVEELDECACSAGARTGLKDMRSIYANKKFCGSGYSACVPWTKSGVKESNHINTCGV